MNLFSMTNIKRGVFGFAGLMVLAVLVSFALPRQIHVERSLVIEASQERIYGYLVNFRRFNEWSPWAARDPETRYSFDGPEEGVGASMTWQSDNPNVGGGSQKITEAEPYTFAKSVLDFGEHGTAEAFYRLEDMGDGQTKVTWGFDTDLGFNPVARYMGLMMDDWIGADYEAGLANLKTLAEQE